MLIHTCKFSFVAILIAITALPLAIQAPKLSVEAKSTQISAPVNTDLEMSTEDGMDFSQSSEQLEQDMGFFTESNAFEDDPRIVPAREMILDEHLDLDGTSKYVHAAGPEQP